MDENNNNYFNNIEPEDSGRSDQYNQDNGNDQSYPNNSGYQNNSEYQNNSGYQNYQGYQSNPNNPNNKKNNKGRKAAIIAASVVAAFMLIAVGSAIVKNMVTYMTDFASKQVSNNQQPDNAVVNGNEPTSRPVKTVQAGSFSGQLIDVSDIVEESMPSVVQISSTTSVKGYSIFGEQYEQEVPTCGTGFIVGQNDTELLLATNNHVVEDATAIQVTFADGESAPAVVKGTDAQADLAVVAVKLKDVKDSTSDAIKIAVLGDSDKAKIGQLVIAIGNAQGMGQSVTVGYLSAKERELNMSDNATGENKTMKFLQTDAAINGGNSGGPLINANGEVIGINSAKISSTDVEGMCFAIPISQAQPIINELMNRETLDESEKGYMGVSLQDISAQAVEMYGVPDGVYVAKVAAGGPAEKAGIKEGDIIIAINDTTVNSSSAAVDKVNSYRAGTEVKVLYCRLKTDSNGYDKLEASVKLATAEEIGLTTSQSGSDSNDSSQTPNQSPYSDNPAEHDFSSDDFEEYLHRFFNW